MAILIQRRSPLSLNTILSEDPINTASPVSSVRLLQDSPYTFTSPSAGFLGYTGYFGGPTFSGVTPAQAVNSQPNSDSSGYLDFRLNSIGFGPTPPSYGAGGPFSIPGGLGTGPAAERAQFIIADLAGPNGRLDPTYSSINAIHKNPPIAVDLYGQSQTQPAFADYGGGLTALGQVYGAVPGLYSPPFVAKPQFDYNRGVFDFQSGGNSKAFINAGERMSYDNSSVYTTVSGTQIRIPNATPIRYDGSTPTIIQYRASIDAGGGVRQQSNFAEYASGPLGVSTASVLSRNSGLPVQQISTGANPYSFATGSPLNQSGYSIRNTAFTGNTSKVYSMDGVAGISTSKSYSLPANLGSFFSSKYGW